MATRTARGFCRIGSKVAILSLTCMPAHAQQVPAGASQPLSMTLPPVVIIGTSPLLGSGVDRDTVPAETNVLKQDDLTRGGTTTADPVRALNEQVGGVNLDSASGNQFQPTMVYHGFQASPLQGTPQGLAVYVNGIRFNQAFGDTVNFDLLPDQAIDEMNLEGSNPVFGLNALGGALNVQLKNGFTWQGGELSLHGGSFSTYGADFEYGRKSGIPRFTRRHRVCIRRAGAICNPPTSRISSAISAGVAMPAKCI